MLPASVGTTSCVVEAALTRAQALWSNGDEAEAERERLEREAARLEAKIRRASYGGLLRGLVPVNAYVAGSLPEPAMQWGDGAQGVSSPRPGGVSWHSAILLSSVL
jgi:hypothetical protein